MLCGRGVAVVASSIGVAADLSVDVTLGQSGSDVGYGGIAGYGSTDPANPMLNSQEIDTIKTSDTINDFKVDILGFILAQTFFTSVTVEDGDGSPRTFFTSAATFSSNATRAQWTWGSGSNGVWDTFDDPEVHPADFFL